MTESSAKPFGTAVSNTSTIAVAAGASWVSVADLLALRVTVQSSEAVAMVAELCALLLGRGADVIPQATDVLVNDEGRLSIRAWDNGDSDPFALGRLLHSLIATAPTPAPLRLFVLHAMSSERYQSVSAFAEALAAYEVAGHAKLIQAVHDRWVATRAAAVSPVPAPPVSEPEQNQQPAKPNEGGRRLPRWAIATVSVAIIGIGATGAWFAAGAQPLSITSLSLSVPAAIQNALRWLDGSKPSDSAAAEPEPRNTKRPRATKPKTAGAPPRASEPGLDQVTAPGTADTTPVTGAVDAVVTTDATDWATSATGIESDSPTLVGVVASPAPVAIGEAPGTLGDVATPAESRVYSSAFPNVKPPVLVTQQITPPETLTTGAEATSTIELLVDESGSVARVRLLSRPSPILATMLLSAAKTWTFKPALNDGRPVKYRLLLDVMTTQR